MGPIEILIYIFIFILGLAFGSFLNSWIWRHQEGKRFPHHRSVCVHCERKLKWWENIPLFSYVLLGGRCLTCGGKIPWHYPLGEFFVAVLLTAAFWFEVNYGGTTLWFFGRSVFFLAILKVIFVTDALYGVIPTKVVYMGAIVGFIINYFFLGVPPLSMLWGALAGFGFFFLQYVISRGRWIGGGDVRMGVLMGVWLGWPVVLVAIFSAYILGMLYSVLHLARRTKTLKSSVPFGAFLAVGTAFAVYAGPVIVSWYAKFLNF